MTGAIQVMQTVVLLRIDVHWFPFQLELCVVWMRAAVVVLSLDCRASSTFEDINAMGFHFVDRLDGHLGQAMMLAWSVVDFFYRLCDVDDFGLVKLLVDHRLNCLVDMVMSVFANLSLLVLYAVGCVLGDSRVLEIAQVCSDLCITSAGVFVSDLTTLHRLEVVYVLLR